MIDRDIILTFFREKTKKPLHFKDIASIMQLDRREGKVLKRTLRMMVRSGDLVLTRKGLYGPPEDMDLVSGYFEAHKDGYGFAIMEKPGERDLFIPARATMGAMNNDRVLVRIENRQKREGRIIRIVERMHTRIAGRLEATRDGLYVKPKDKSIPFDIRISHKDRAGAKKGEMVIAEILSPSADRKLPAGRIVKVMGKVETPRSEIEMIIDEFDLPRKFPGGVHKEAAALTIPETEESGRLRRKDLRSLPTVTIDGERARDFDDAVSVKLSAHGYKLYVHIADVGSYIAWDSAIDAEARKRGTSVYFPDRVIPMLPKELSEDLCSLKPEVERLSFTVEMNFDRSGTRLDSKFYPSVITSDRRMTYTSVRKILVDNDPRERAKYDNLLKDFELMGELCGVLRKKRLERGSLDFDLPEPEVLLDIRGVPEAIVKAERNFAHIIIEEFMIAANEAVAEHLDSLGIPVLYRVHEEPDPLKLENMAALVKPAFKSRQHLKPTDVPEILRVFKGKPEEEVINYMVLRSLKQARYSHINVGHFGLASKCYTHFTSPIRRYPDLVVHRILREVLNKRRLSDKRIQELNSLLPDIAFLSSRAERMAAEAEREVLEAMRTWFMKGKVGEEFGATVAGVTPYGLRVRLKDFFVDGFIHVSYLTDDFYRFDEQQMKLSGRNTRKSFSIGKELKVRLDRVDMEDREIILDICNKEKPRRTS